MPAFAFICLKIRGNETRHGSKTPYGTRTETIGRVFEPRFPLQNLFRYIYLGGNRLFRSGSSQEISPDVTPSPGWPDWLVETRSLRGEWRFPRFDP